MGEHRDKCFMVSACGKDLQLDVNIKCPEVSPVRGATIRECLYYSRNNEDVGDVLYRLEGPLLVPRGESRQIWLTFNTRQNDRKPGRYPFTLVLRDRSSGVERSVPGFLTVWDFELPSWDAIPNNAYVEFHNSEVGAKILGKAVKDMKSYGVNMVYVYPNYMPWPVEIDEKLNIVKFDTAGLARMVKPPLMVLRCPPRGWRASLEAAD